MRNHANDSLLLTGLPLDILLQIFCYCNFFDVLNLSAVGASHSSGGGTDLTYLRLVHDCKKRWMNTKYGYTKPGFSGSPSLPEQHPRRVNLRTGSFLVSKWMYVGA